MTKPNFQAMTKQELRGYVLEHRDDREAFYALTDKLREAPGTEIESSEDLHQLIEQKRSLADVKDARTALKEAAEIGTMSLEEFKKELGL